MEIRRAEAAKRDVQFNERETTISKTESLCTCLSRDSHEVNNVGGKL